MERGYKVGIVGAFFDIDGTLYREGLITEVFKKLIKYEIVDPIKWHLDVKPKYLKWDKRLGDYDDYLLGMVEIYKEALKGIDKSEVEFIAKQVISQKGDRVYTFTRDALEYHKKEGHKVVVISGSPIEIVSEMARKYDIQDFRGSIYVLNSENRYTGEIIPMWDRASKEKAMKEVSAKYNIDLNRSYAYGDTSGDFCMFKLVGYPVCVNPTKELLKEILEDEIKEKIKIIVERKDVVYTLNAGDLNYR